MLCSRGIVGGIGEEALALEDADGVSLRQALLDFGLDPTDIAKAARKPGEVFAYVEAHIEQGPVLEDRDLAIGVVTGIAAQLRLKARFIGLAGHAGTSPMGLRKDAIAAAAAGVLAVEEICLAGAPDLRGTVGRFLPKTAAYNVIAGEVEMGIDLRASTGAVRDAAAEAIKIRLAEIAQQRGVTLEFTVVQNLPATPLRRAHGAGDGRRGGGGRRAALPAGQRRRARRHVGQRPGARGHAVHPLRRRDQSQCR